MEAGNFDFVLSDSKAQALKRLIILFMVVQFFGCNQERDNHPIFKYYPEPDLLEEGYVNKYYFHYYPDNTDQRPITYIEYVKFVKLDDRHFMTEDYNAGFRLTNNRYYEIKADTLLIEKGMGVDSYNPTDTTQLDLVNNIVSVWGGQMPEPFQLQYEFGDQSFIYNEYQLSSKDSIIMEKPAKIFVNKWNTHGEGSDSLFNEGTSKAYYVQGFGFFGSDSKGPGYTRQAELIEQMSVEDFEKRASHGEHRVAWIDPDNTLSDDSYFSICGHELNIADYYNSTPDGRYIHSKRALLDTVNANLDKSRLFEQNGKLVFRFVVNCEGKAGRFIARGYDLSYQPMEFEDETVNHLFSILQKLKEWRPVVIRDEPRDAYFYITFNIEDGEIKDILP